MFQDRLLYFPEHAEQADVVSERLTAWPSGQDFRGLLADTAEPVRGVAVVFHGNAGHVGHREFYAAALTPLGLRVILAEYPGYGPRRGGVGERSLVADAQQSIALAYRSCGAPLLLIGESLGASVAAAASAGQSDKITGLLLITPWDRLANVASFHYPWLPVKWLLADPYDSASHLATFDRRVLVAVAEEDTVVPARFGKALFDGLDAPKQLSVLRNAEHNDWVDRVDNAWWRQAIEFLLGGSGNSEPRW